MKTLLNQLAIVAMLFAITSKVDGKSTSLCNEFELSEVEKNHQLCIKHAEDRFLLSAEKPELNQETNNGTTTLLICDMMTEFFEKCGQLYQKCLTEKEYR
jgi:hypothetical protein